VDFGAMRQTMVDTQIRVNDVTDFNIVSAFTSVPRELFVPKSAMGIAYSESEIKTSEGRSLWTPRDISKLISAAKPSASDLAMFIGAGSGYEAGVLSKVVDTAIALEDDTSLVDQMTERFAEIGLDSAVAVEGSLAEGLPNQAPFDLIIVGGMVERLSDDWADQLSESEEKLESIRKAAIQLVFGKYLIAAPQNFLNLVQPLLLIFRAVSAPELILQQSEQCSL